MKPTATHSEAAEGPRPFTLVLGGGGARGFAHAGVLYALAHEGYAPSAIVGVSMGAVVGVTYAVRDDWYPALLAMDTHTFPRPMGTAEGTPPLRRLKAYLTYLRAAFDLLKGWGPGIHALDDGKNLLQHLFEGKNLEEGRLPVAVSTTDFLSGRRHVFYQGDARDAVYASVALAGILPPLPYKGRLLGDGAYADIAPIDVGRTFGHPVVIAVDPGQALVPRQVENGYQALFRATEICHLRHADLRFGGADLVLKPAFPRLIDTLDFDARRICVAAGIQAVRQHREALNALIRGAGPLRPRPDLPHAGHPTEPTRGSSHGMDR